MSYCAINLANGFGQQPGDKIRFELSNASCVCNCSDMEVAAVAAAVNCGSFGSATASVTGLTSAVGFLWDNGETSATAARLIPGWHYVTVTSQGTPACKIIKGVNVNGMLIPIPPKPNITKSNDTLISSIQSGNKWFRNGSEISGALGNYYPLRVEGDYTVQATINGCISEMSDAYTYMPVTTVMNKDLEVLPNPVDKFVSVRNSNRRNLTIQLTSILGQRLLTVKSSDLNISINVSNYPPGSYALLIIDTDNNEKLNQTSDQKIEAIH